MKTRIIGSAGSCYHVFSRIVERRFYLGPHDKEIFRDMMWRAAEFSGINILTYCILDNHFHILVEVPGPQEIDDDELYRRLNILYGQSRPSSWNDPLGEFQRSESDPAWRARLREKYTHRMYNLSEFMRTLKLRFSFWYNRRHKRIGGLWDARFGSVIVEDRSSGSRQSTGNLALVTVAAYIDLNALRAGIVENPEHYRWCGFAEASAVGEKMRYGMAYLYGLRQLHNSDWRDAVSFYRSVLYEKAGIVSGMPENGAFLRRVRYFTAGAILGSKAFVNEIFLRNRAFFGARRQSGARRMLNGDWQGLCAARQVG